MSRHIVGEGPRVRTVGGSSVASTVLDGTFILTTPLTETRLSKASVHLLELAVAGSLLVLSLGKRSLE